MHIVLALLSRPCASYLGPNARAAKLCSGKAAEFRSAAKFDNAKAAEFRNVVKFDNAKAAIFRNVADLCNFPNYTGWILSWIEGERNHVMEVTAR